MGQALGSSIDEHYLTNFPPVSRGVRIDTSRGQMPLLKVTGQEVVELDWNFRASCLPTPRELSWHQERPSRQERKRNDSFTALGHFQQQVSDFSSSQSAIQAETWQLGTRLQKNRFSS